MVKLTSILSRLKTKKILVAGDFMLDTYTVGKARRISPEAPVAVVQVQKEEHRPGGAGNVALNLISMGARVTLLGRVGNDSAGDLLKNLFTKEKIGTESLLTQGGFKTPVKNRVIADNQQIVRVDHEEISSLPEMLEQRIYENLSNILADVEVLAISDYGKGFFSNSLLSALIDHARALGIPIISDPKGVDFGKYSGCTVIKPNLSEAYAAANLGGDAPLDTVAEKVLALCKADVLMITRAELGISLFYKEGQRLDFPVCAKEVKDVTGAGDTVLAVVACAMANGLSLGEAVQLSNIAAGIAIEHFGCARVTLGDLARRMLQVDVANKVFDEGHSVALKMALENKRYNILCLSGDAGLTSQVFNSIRQLALENDSDLLIFLQDAHPDSEFIDILASLHDVDFIFWGEEEVPNFSLYNLFPKRICSLQNGFLTELSPQEASILTPELFVHNVSSEPEALFPQKKTT